MPARLTAALHGRSPDLQVVLLTMITAQFLHAGWVHIVGNLVYLRVFGDHVENELGPVAFPSFYVAAGVFGLATQYAVQPHSAVPIIGDSGAIAGVLGAYVVLFPRAKVLTLFPVLIFLTFVEVPAALFVGVWGAQQLLNGLLMLQGATDNVAWFAHIGGFGFGVFVGLAVRIGAWLRRVRLARAAQTAEVS